MKPEKLFYLVHVLMFLFVGCEKKPTKTLHQAAMDGDIAQVKLHISRGADVNARNKDSLTPLHEAVRKDHTDVCELLIANGADVNVKDDRGRTPLWWAKLRGYKEMVELLRKHGADE